MKLYNNNLSPFCARVRYVIYSRALPIVVVDPPADFRERAPMGKVPALEVENHTIMESEAILEFFHDVFAPPIVRRLLPLDPFLRAQARSLSRINDLYLQLQMYQLAGAKAGTPHYDELLAGINRALDTFEAKCAGKWLVGHEQSLADIALTATLMSTHALLIKRHNLDVLAHRPKLAAWWAHQQLDHDWRCVFTEFNDAVQAQRRKAKL